MKKTKRLVFAVVIAAVMFMSACSGVSPTPDTTAEPTASPGVETKTILNNLDCEIELEIRDSKLMINRLVSYGSGKNFAAENSEFALPSMVDIVYPKIGINGPINVQCNWEFSGYRVYESLEDDIRQVIAEYSFIEKGKNLITHVNCISRPEISGPFEFYTVIENANPEDADASYYIIPRDYVSFELRSMEKDVTVWSFRKEGTTAEGGAYAPDGTLIEGTGIYKYTFTYDAENGFPNLTPTAAITANLWNFNSCIPMLYADVSSECGAYIALESSTGRVTVRRSEDKKSLTLAASLDYGQNDDGCIFRTKLTSGQVLNLSPVYLGVYDGDIDDGSNAFKSWFFNCKAPDTLRDNPNEPFSQMDVDIGAPFDAIKYCIESIKWDYGWWAIHGFESPHSFQGSWKLRHPHYIYALEHCGCETMADFGELAIENGLNWAVYILLHDSLDLNGKPTAEGGEFSSLLHPEWFSDRVIVGGASADLGNEECVEYLKKALADFMNENHIKTWRSDLEPICAHSDKENRHTANGTDVMFWCEEGFHEIVEYLQENVEGFRYESCSAGGGFKDLSTATIATVINCDDTANYLSLRISFYDSSYVIHPSQLQLPCNPDTFNTYINTCLPKYDAADYPDDFDLHSAVINMGFRSTVLGAPMWSSWTGTWLYDYYEVYAHMFSEKIRPLMRDGNLYHILPRPDGVNWDGVMYADKDSENEIKGALFLFKPSAEAENVKNVVLKGLDENTVYRLTFEDRPEQNITATGEQLMSEGINVEIEYVGSEIIWITEA